MDKPSFERHWLTSRLVEVFAGLQTDEWIAKADVAEKCGVGEDAIEKRYRSAYLIAEREHHVIVRPERRDKVSGFRRFDQADADIPSRKYLNGAKNKAKRATNVIKHGVVDFEKIPPDKRRELFALQSQAAVIARASDARTTRALTSGPANARIDVGRTLEFLKK